MTPAWADIQTILLAVSLLATVGIAAAVWRQARRHFQLEHSRGFIERFNSEQMVGVRRTVDEWLLTAETPADLNARVAEGNTEAREVSDALRTLSNFFQELGVAYSHAAVRPDYTWDVFGALSARYWRSLEPYVRETRTRLGRPILHSDFEDFAGTMEKSDVRHGVETVAAPPVGSAEAWVFGYGSLMNPESIARTVGEDLDRSRLRTTWLNGYRRAWTVWDRVLFRDPSRPVSLAYLALGPDPGSRCNGVLFPVARAQLPHLDERERNYVRIDVTSSIEADVVGTVYTYVGQPEYAELPPDTVVAQYYTDLIGGALDLWGDEFRVEYHASTRTTDLEIVEGRYDFSPDAPEPFRAD